MSYKTILYEVEGAVAKVTCNRPDKLNALNEEMFGELASALDRVANDAAVRALVLTGAGRAFVAGADIEQFTRLDPLTAREFAQVGFDLGLKLEGLEIPVIAAVNGFALGGGCELAMACDIIYASEEAKFGQPEINIGIMPGFGGSQRLARLVGKGLAMELCLTGRMIDAHEAKAAGLVARVFPADTLMEGALKVARTLAEKGRVAVRGIKRVIHRGFDLDLHSACAMEMDAFALCFASPDAFEGATAFLEKRKPKFAP
jgi:enoyl-CoA hydratase